jgi:hypothetical protein
MVDSPVRAETRLRLTVLRHDLEREGQSPAGGIRSLEQSADGALWLDARDASRRRIRFVPFADLRQGQLPSGAVEALLRARGGDLWVGLNGRRSIARLRPHGVTLFGEAEGLPNSQVTSLYEDAGPSGQVPLQGSIVSMKPVDACATVGATLCWRFARTLTGAVAVGPMAVFRRTSADAPFMVERLLVASNRWQSLSMDRQGRCVRLRSRLPDAGRQDHVASWRGAARVGSSCTTRAARCGCTRGQGAWRSWPMRTPEPPSHVA